MLFEGLVMHVCNVKFQAGAGATLGRTLWGMLGLGAFGFQLQEVPEGKRIITTTRSHSNKLVSDTVQAMEPHDVIRVGGAGNKVCDKSSSYSETGTSVCNIICNISCNYQ